jgi:hypothetical protein
MMIEAETAKATTITTTTVTASVNEDIPLEVSADRLGVKMCLCISAL